ncbi:MAG TPA: DUF3341 domain-containing protein [Lacunisphaera sp.]|jgi:hypothetical protein
MKSSNHGLLAEFSAPDDLLEAVKRAREEGFTQFETFAPYPVEGLEEMELRKPSNIPGVMLAAAAIGAAGGFGMQWYAARVYPINVGGRPLFSWPAFVPVTFELGVLSAVIVGILTFLWRARLPRYDYPVFAVPQFSRASTDRFFFWLREDDPKYSPASALALLKSLKTESIAEVPR